MIDMNNWIYFVSLYGDNPLIRDINWNNLGAELKSLSIDQLGLAIEYIEQMMKVNINGELQSV